jgi:hypothetical protein
MGGHGSSSCSQRMGRVRSAKKMVFPEVRHVTLLFISFRCDAGDRLVSPCE